MSRSEHSLMARSRLQLPPLPLQASSSSSLSSTLASPDNRQSLKRQASYEEPASRARKSYTFGSGLPDMQTYHGHVRTPADAILLFEACRMGLLPRVARRLSEKERQMIKSGSVFVWDEREAGMRRWTDGKSWSASRVSGSFLTYREMEGKRGGGGNGYAPPVAALSRPGRTPESAPGSESDIDVPGEEGPDGYRYKPDGLVKQSFSITTSQGNHLHLISYYSRSHPASQQLPTPTTDPSLAKIRPTKGLYPESSVHEQQNIPAVTRSPMGGAPYTTTPQMAGYARQGPSQWSQQQPTPPQAWPPNQQSQPPYQYYGYQYGPPPLNQPPPPPGSNTAYGPPQPYSQQQPNDPNYNGYDPRQQAPRPESQNYDGRRYSATSPLSRPLPPHDHTQPAENRPPPNAPYNHSNLHPNTSREGYPAPPYNSQQYQRSPHTQHQSYSSPRPPALQTNGGQPPSQSQPSWTRGPLPPPQPAPSPGQYHPQPGNTSATPIDPQLTGAASIAQNPGNLNAQQSNAGPRPPQQTTTTSPPLLANTYQTSAASSIPSIGSLMNGSGPQNQRPMANQPAPPPAQHQSPGHSNYPPHPERKLGAEKASGSEGPQDLPSSKPNFHEDKRAKGLLDRGFL